MGRDGLSERITARCTPKVKAAIRDEMRRTGQSESQIIEDIVLQHLTGDPQANALGTLISRLARDLSSQFWDSDQTDAWFDSPYKHAVITNAVNRLLELLRPEGDPKTPPEVMKALKFPNLDTLADHTTAGVFTAGSLAKNISAREPDPAAAMSDTGFIKWLLKPKTGEW